MRIYLDDDSVETLLVRLLRQVPHDVIIPANVALSGQDGHIVRVHCTPANPQSHARKIRRTVDNCDH